MGKIKNNLRLIVQACWTALTNGYVYGYLEGKIYTGQAKKICVPGLNCYSCPGAFGACPIGSLQAVLDSSTFRVSCYVLGFLMMFGSLFGRFVGGLLAGCWRWGLWFWGWDLVVWEIMCIFVELIEFYTEYGLFIAYSGTWVAACVGRFAG